MNNGKIRAEPGKPGSKRRKRVEAFLEAFGDLTLGTIAVLIADYYFYVENL